jgi:hypothetical protein
MKSNTFGGAKLVMYGEGERVAGGMGLKGSTSNLSGRQETFQGAWGKDSGTNLRSMVAEDRNVTESSGCRDAENTITGRCIFMAIGRDEADTAGVTGGVLVIGVKVTGVVSCGCLGTTVHVGTRAVKIVMANIILGQRHECGVLQDLLKDASGW